MLTHVSNFTTCPKENNNTINNGDKEEFQIRKNATQSTQFYNF